jgi:hypothetical protein
MPTSANNNAVPTTAQSYVSPPGHTLDTGKASMPTKCQAANLPLVPSSSGDGFGYLCFFP